MFFTTISFGAKVPMYSFRTALGKMDDADLGTNYLSGLSTADLDNDGDSDFVGANRSGLCWWKNDGTGEFTINLIRESTYNTTDVKLLVDDCDNDGDVDILVSVRDRNQIFLYKNDGSANFTEEELSDVSNIVKTPTYMIMADIKDSGVYDILVYMEATSKIWRWRKSTYSSGGPYIVVDSVDNLGKMGIGDFNNDGKTDLTVTNRDNDSLIWYENSGFSGSDWESEKHIIHSNFQYIGGLCVTDLDGDANLDIIVTSINTDSTVGDAIWCKNDGSGAFTLVTLIQDFDNLYGAYATDLDGDGDKDIYGYGRNSYDWWENDGNENFTVYHGINRNIYHIEPLITDIDGDGDQDFIGARYDMGFIYYFRNELRNKVADVIDPISVKVYDMDNDGDMDIFGVMDDGFSWWSYIDSLKFSTHELTLDGLSDTRSGMPIDLDKDGDVDIIGAGNNELYWLEKNKEFEKQLISSFTNATTTYGADINGNGYIDVVCASSGKSHKISWFENNAATTFTEHVITNESEATDIIISDINNDGYGDIIYASKSDNRIGWFRWSTKSEGFVNEPQIITNSFSNVSSIYAVDMDKDGDIDVLASAGNGKIAWWEQTNTEFTKFTITSSFDAASSVYAADADGDGDMDIMCTDSKNDYVVWMENDGSQNFTTHYLDKSSDYAISICAADIDGDGAMDIVSAAENDNEIMMFKLTDSPEGTAVLTDGSKYMPDNDIIADSENNIIGRFSLQSFSSISTIALKLHIATESEGLYNFKLWESRDGNFSSISDCQLGLISANNPGDEGIITFSNYSSQINGKDDCYYFVTCDAKRDASGTIQLFITTSEDISFSGGTLSPKLSKSAPLSYKTVNVGIATKVNSQNDLLPNKYSLEQNYPNPFNPSTKISYSLPQAAKVTINVYNILGQQVAALLNSQKPAGKHAVTFDATNISAGLYFYEIKANNFRSIKKMLLVK
jgi:hypothetical protein